MSIKHYILPLLLMISCYSFAQQDTAKQVFKNAVFLELGGNALLYSMNYEKKLINISAKWDLSGRIGIAYYPILNHDTYFPVSINAYYGKKSKLEIGICYTAIFRWKTIIKEKQIFNYKYQIGDGYIQGHDEPYAEYLFFNIGWHKELNKNLFVKIKSTTIINKLYIFPWIGFCIGKML